MTLFGSKIFDGAMICNDCYEKLSTTRQEVQPAPSHISTATSSGRSRTTTIGMGSIRRDNGEFQDTKLTQQIQSDPVQTRTETAVRSTRKKQKNEELTPLTPTKIGGLIKAQKMREQQDTPHPQKDEDFTPLSPDQFIGLFRGPKREEFIEPPEEREEDFTQITPDKFQGYTGSVKGKEQKSIETNLAEAVGKFMGPLRGKTSPEIRDQEDYMERTSLSAPKKKFPHINLLTSRPLTPVRQIEKTHTQETEINEELYQALDTLYKQQENLGNYLSELHQKIDYQTQILEEIYRALEQYLSGEY